MNAESSVIEELRLTRFKSFRDATLPLGALTLLVGRNGSGKSNALDGLSTLVRLAGGEPLRSALDGGRDGPAVRGGLSGAPPVGELTFTLGATVRTGAELVGIDLTVAIEPTAQIVAEQLWWADADAPDQRHLLYATDPTDGSSADLVVVWTEGERVDSAHFRADRMLATQVLARVPATETGRRIHRAAARLLAGLGAVFALDPVPSAMRRYVPRRDSQLRRDGDNLSAAIAELVTDPGNLRRLLEAVGTINEQDVVDLTVTASGLDDVMLVAVEQAGAEQRSIPARLMSDGTLRFLAILTALMQTPAIDTTPETLAAGDAVGQTLLVIEELENGLHSSQAATVLGAIHEQVGERRARVLATCHSPTVLDALDPDEHDDVVICQRRADGTSTLTRLADLPEYFQITARGTLGSAAIEDRLRRSTSASAGGGLGRLLDGVA